jgi:hypothetical protein
MTTKEVSEIVKISDRSVIDYANQLAVPFIGKGRRKEYQWTEADVQRLRLALENAKVGKPSNEEIARYEKIIADVREASAKINAANPIGIYSDDFDWDMLEAMSALGYGPSDIGALQTAQNRLLKKLGVKIDDSDRLFFITRGKLFQKHRTAPGFDIDKYESEIKIYYHMGRIINTLQEAECGQKRPQLPPYERFIFNVELAIRDAKKKQEAGGNFKAEFLKNMAFFGFSLELVNEWENDTISRSVERAYIKAGCSGFLPLEDGLETVMSWLKKEAQNG